MFKDLTAVMDKAAEKENFTSRQGGAEEFEVKELEEAFNITLPADYKFYLLKYGYTLWCGEIICGFVDKGAMFEGTADVIPTTQYYRKLYNDDNNYTSVSSEGVVIGSYDGGGYYFLFSQESERAGEVGLFLTEAYGQEVSKFKIFTDYLSFLVTGTPEPEPVEVDYDEIMDIIED